MIASSSRATVMEQFAKGPPKLVLGVQGSCFLCLASSSPKDMTEVSFWNICRFLNVNAGSFSPKLLHENSLGNLPEKLNILEPLCTTCASLTNNISELVTQMEMISMLLTYQLQVFHQVLSQSCEQQQSIVEQNDGKEEAHSMDQLLRFETLKKCSKKVERLMKRTVPKVQLHRLQVTSNSHRPANPSNELNPRSRNFLSINSNATRKIWSCSVTGNGCGQTFAHQHSLTRHKRSYCPKRKYRQRWICNLAHGGCNQTFCDAFSLRRHRKKTCQQNKTVDAQNEWECSREGCKRKFTRKYNLTRHMKRSCPFSKDEQVLDMQY